MYFAHRNDGGLYLLDTVTSESQSGNSSWTISLRCADQGGDFVRDTMGYAGTGGQSYSADDVAEMRARRILLNEQTQASDVMLEAMVRGLGNTGTTSESALPRVFAEVGDEDPVLLLKAMRLAAILQLRLSRTVEHVLRLSVGPIVDRKMKVFFIGKRHRVFSNKEPPTIEVVGECAL